MTLLVVCRFYWEETLQQTSENNLNKGLVERISDIFGDTSSVHNCYGLGQQQCVIDGYRTKGDLKMGNERTIF